MKIIELLNRIANEENLQCSKYAIENQELKKQLEENKHKGLYNTCLPYSTGYKKQLKKKKISKK